MDNSFTSFPVTGFKQIKQQVLTWVNQFSTCCFLDNHQYYLTHHRYECIAAAGVVQAISLPAGTALQQLQVFRQQHNGWLFGHLGYDLKNEIEDLYSTHPDHIGFPDLFFFVPETVILLNEHQLSISAASKEEAQQIFTAICKLKVTPPIPFKQQIIFQPRISKQHYTSTIEQLQHHILRGDCYEINFCQEFFAENMQIEPLNVYQALSEISPSPFAAFYKLTDKYLLCASPERYLKKEGNTIIAQPIKGTSKRNVVNEQQDLLSKNDLRNNAKDRSENVMVVDLVRNDLSKLCTEGSVEVEELFGVYSFPQVHQMISTVRGSLRPGLSFTDIVTNTFPMGSMTGAPKKKVMELIEAYEPVRRGIFSGAVGYVAPDDDFDFNVVIRSIMYNQATNYLSYLVGSGITFYSEVSAEYDECLLKAEAIKKVFSL